MVCPFYKSLCFVASYNPANIKPGFTLKWFVCLLQLIIFLYVERDECHLYILFFGILEARTDWPLCPLLVFFFLGVQQVWAVGTQDTTECMLSLDFWCDVWRFLLFDITNDTEPECFGFVLLVLFGQLFDWSLNFWVTLAFSQLGPKMEVLSCVSLSHTPWLHWQ